MRLLTQAGIHIPAGSDGFRARDLRRAPGM